MYFPSVISPAIAASSFSISVLISPGKASFFPSYVFLAYKKFVSAESFISSSTSSIVFFFFSNCSIFIFAIFIFFSSRYSFVSSTNDSILSVLSPNKVSHSVPSASASCLLLIVISPSSSSLISSYCE